MSLREFSSAPCFPVTAVAWTSNASTCPKDLTLITATEDGAAANFGRGFGKTGYYLCYSTKTAGMVVSDMQVIAERESTPHGYCYIPEYMESKASVWKKKRVCVRIVPLGTVETAVLDIKLTTKSKVVVPHYTCIGEVHGYVIWCKMGRFSEPKPAVKPRSISLDIRKLSLDQLEPPKPLQVSNGPAATASGKLSHRRSNLQNKDKEEHIYLSIIPQSITAVDGIPFALNPKFEASSKSMGPSDTLNIHIKSVQDIENEYNYTFTVEEKAAQRFSPRKSVSPPSPKIFS
ncbi:hypothetical protein AGOR_G00196530 [Albula goreensis]|uniref:Multivesicular body subunit 12A n=1 Tax=Albula goreensis TaxID=1534307 RepID=A0A8T3CN28_9TELE|nr:hypothetical protein AGOR_G00196530 [Albula goreensis]